MNTKSSGYRSHSARAHQSAGRTVLLDVLRRKRFFPPNRDRRAEQAGRGRPSAAHRSRPQWGKILRFGSRLSRSHHCDARGLPGAALLRVTASRPGSAAQILLNRQPQAVRAPPLFSSHGLSCLQALLCHLGYYLSLPFTVKIQPYSSGISRAC